MCFVLFVCIFVYTHVFFNTLCEFIIKSIFIGPRSIAGVPLSQAAPAYLITAHHLCAFLLYRLRASCVAALNKNQKTCNDSTFRTA